jgi:hypothetical protein
MHNPEKKDSTSSAIAEAVIFVFSASILITRRRCNNRRQRNHGLEGRAADNRSAL